MDGKGCLLAGVMRLNTGSSQRDWSVAGDCVIGDWPKRGLATFRL